MLWSHVEDTFGGKVQILVNNAGVNPVRGWRACMDIMIYGVMIGSYMARDKMGATKVFPHVAINSQVFEVLLKSITNVMYAQILMF